MATQDPTSERMPPLAAIALWATAGFATASALLLWLERGTAILLDLSALSAAFLCF